MQSAIANPKSEIRNPKSPSPYLESISTQQKGIVLLRLSSENSLVQLIIRKASVRWRAAASRATAVTTGRARFLLGTPPKNHADTDPAGLIAAAHATSFSMALSEQLRLGAFATGEIVIMVTLTLEKPGASWTVLNIHLDVIARLPKVKQTTFIDATIRAKTTCLVSPALRAKVSIKAKLEN